jgi:hypothetical protein
VPARASVTGLSGVVGDDVFEPREVDDVSEIMVVAEGVDKGRTTFSMPVGALDKERAWSVRDIKKKQKRQPNVLCEQVDLYKEKRTRLTGSARPTLLPTVQNVLLNICHALAVFAVPLLGHLPHSTQEILR